MANSPQWRNNMELVYGYQYNSLTVQIATIERVPEKIIRAHDEVNFN